MTELFDGNASNPPVEAFDADVLIYASMPGHPLCARIRRRLVDARAVGSVVLLPELLSKPIREDRRVEFEGLSAVLSVIRLVPCDAEVAALAASLGARYCLRAADAVHLATAVSVGAGVFNTNNRKDFRASLVTEIRIAYPDDLPATTAP